MSDLIDVTTPGDGGAGTRRLPLPAAFFVVEHTIGLGQTPKTAGLPFGTPAMPPLA
jgi:hypothetical protein